MGFFVMTLQVSMGLLHLGRKNSAVSCIGIYAYIYTYANTHTHFYIEKVHI